MSEMIERVAKAIFAVNAEYGSKRSWKEFTDDARAAIAAMREPTEKMIDEALEEAKYQRGINIKVTWLAMIDASLK